MGWTNFAGQVVVAGHLVWILPESPVITDVLNHVFAIGCRAHPGMPLLEMELVDALDARPRRTKLDEVIDDPIVDHGQRLSCRRRPVGVPGHGHVRVTRAVLARRIEAIEEARNPLSQST